MRLLAIVFLAAVCSADEWPPAGIRKELAVLDDPKRIDEHEARAAARRRFERLVADGGAALVDQAVARIGDPRAQLILACAKVSPAQLARLAKARAPAVALYPALRARRFVEPVALQAKGLRYPTDDTALKQVAKEIHARILPQQDPVAPAKKEEYVKDWHAVIKPRLLTFWKQIPRTDRFLIGKDRMIVVARELVKTHWIHDHRFVAVLAREAGRWKVEGFHRFRENEQITEAVVGDFDGNGTLEAGVWTWWGGGYSYGEFFVFSADKPDGVRIEASAYRPFTDTPVVKGADGSVYFTRWNYHRQTPGNKHKEAIGVIAYAVHLYRWRPNGFVHAGRALIPLR